MTNTPKTNKLDELELQKRKVEIEKIELEKEKIIIESAELRKKFWKRNPQVWGFWTAVVAAVGSFGFLWLNGNFEVRAERLKVEIANFTNEKKLVQDSIIHLKDSLKIFRDSSNTVSSNLTLKRSEIDLLRSQINESNKIKNDLNSNLRSRDQIIADINSKSQEGERRMNDSIQKLIFEYDEVKKRLLKLNSEFYVYSEKSKQNADEYQINLINYKECEISNKRLRNEIEILRKKTQ